MWNEELGIKEHAINPGNQVYDSNGCFGGYRSGGFAIRRSHV